ncbi:hypothetical protein [Bacillus cereus]|uniref:hypothetical protein n=1 Tax=Bacillus cereus TaxID=1396 RepID=UPI000C28DB9F|nr:hypothetical protein [Bacillus cereus]
MKKRKIAVVTLTLSTCFSFTQANTASAYWGGTGSGNSNNNGWVQSYDTPPTPSAVCNPSPNNDETYATECMKITNSQFQSSGDRFVKYTSGFYPANVYTLTNAQTAETEVKTSWEQEFNNALFKLKYGYTYGNKNTTIWSNQSQLPGISNNYGGFKSAAIAVFQSYDKYLVTYKMFKGSRNGSGWGGTSYNDLQEKTVTKEVYVPNQNRGGKIRLVPADSQLIQQIDDQRFGNREYVYTQ